MSEKNITIGPQDVKDWNLFIGVPCYGGAITEEFFMSTIEAVQMFSALGMKFSINTIQDSLISRSRNILTAKFLASDCTHMLFIDADIGYDPRAILRLLIKDKEIVTAAYPIKEINWAQVKERAESGSEAADLVEHGVRFVVNFKPDSNGVISVVDGIMEVHDAGTGFMMIKREALLKMIEAYPELKFTDDGGALVTEEDNKWAYAFFNSYIDENNRFLSEDYGFCRYWQKIGGRIWVDPSIQLTHVGKMKYKGTLINALNKIGKFGTNV
jgi:hypothetical protein